MILKLKKSFQMVGAKGGKLRARELYFGDQTVAFSVNYVDSSSVTVLCTGAAWFR